MASPFRIFRKHVKPLLAVFVVMLMLSWVVGDSLVAYLGGTRAQKGDGGNRDGRAVAVTWDNGSLTNQELDRLLMRRRMVNSFLQGIEYAGMQSSMEAGVEPRDLSVQRLLAPPTEESVVATKLFADAARATGMRVSDDAIVRYLGELGRGHVTGDQMRQMINRPGGAPVQIQYIMDALREEMLAHNYLASHQYAFLTVTPEQRYQDWLRVNDRVVVEAAAIPVESFVGDVPAPTEAELAEFFDEHKAREPQPDLIGQMELPSPVPGFRQPRKIDVQYIEANYDQFLAKVENEITEEEIAKYYEENKDPLFIKADTGLIEESPHEPATSPPAQDVVPTNRAPTSGTAEPEAKTGNDSGALPTDNNGAPSPEPPTADEAKPPADASEPAAVPETGDQSSHGSRPGRGVFRLANFLQQPNGGAADANSAPATNNQPAPQASDAVQAPLSSSEAPAQSADAGRTEIDTQADAPAAASAADQGAAPPPIATTVPAEVNKPKDFQPLDEVRDVIRRNLAAERASNQLNDLMAQLHSQVNAEFTKYFGMRLAAETDGHEVPPPPAVLTDLEPLAREHGLQHGSTGPLSWLEMRKTPVGASGGIESQTELYRMLFASDEVELYRPILTQDIDANRFLAMKMSDVPGRIPALAEVRDEVMRAWKLQKAAEKAQQRAEELAKKAQESKGSLTEAFADVQSVEVVHTDPFSRYTGGDVVFVGGRREQQPFRLSQPSGIVAAGPEFMEEVFGLKEGDVGAVLNHDHSIAYVVRVAEHQLPPDELHNAYLAEANFWPGVGIMMNDHLQLATRLLAADIFANRGLKWERPPDQQRAEEE